MPCLRAILRRVVVLFLICPVCIAGDGEGADKVAATVLVKDSLTAPRHEATIEAKVVSKGLLHDAPLGGEPVELLVNGTVTATGMSGGDGRVLMSFVPPTRSILPLQVRVANSPRVSAAEGQANLVVWERRTPVLMVELSSLIQEPAGDGPLSGIAPRLQDELKPMSDAADELGKLSQFYYGIMYVAAVPSGADGFTVSAQTRGWLESHKFPRGLVLTLPSGGEALGAKMDELHEAGWKTIKTGIGRSKAFVETFLRRRLDAIMIPEPSKGDAPRKA